MADYIICNGKIVNGKNEAPFEGNIIIEGSRIKEITKTTEFPSDFPTERILDAKGGYVTPGFIDIHRHGDWQALENGDDELLNRQGLTTVVNGNCGLSVARSEQNIRRRFLVLSVALPEIRRRNI